METICNDAMPQADGQLLDVNDLAAILKCSSRTVYRLADSGAIPAPRRLGGLRRWTRTAIDSWLASGCPDAKASRKFSG